MRILLWMLSFFILACSTLNAKPFQAIKEGVIPVLHLGNSQADSIYQVYSYLEFKSDVSISSNPAEAWLSISDFPARILREEEIALRFFVNNSSESITQPILYLHNLQYAQVFIKNEEVSEVKKAFAGVLLSPEKRQMYPGLILEKTGNSAQVQLELKPGISEIHIQARFLFADRLNQKILLYPLALWQEKVFQQRAAMLPIQGIVLGVLVILAFYHLLIFLQKRQRAFLLYPLYIVLVTFITWSEMGLLQVYVLPQNSLLYRILDETQVWSLLVAAVYLLFMREFVSLSKILPRYDKFLLRFLAVLVPSGLILSLVYGLTRSNFCLQFVYVYTFSTLLLSLVYAYAIVRTRDVFAIYFVVGSACLLIGVLANTICIFLQELALIQEPSFSTAIIVEIGILLEVLVFAFGLNLRQRLEQRQHDQIKSLIFQAQRKIGPAFEKEEPAQRLSRILEQFTELKKWYDNWTSAKSSSKQTKPQKEFISGLVNFVESRLDDPNLSVADLCEAANLSNMQVNRKLKAMTGKTPSLFIRHIRLQKGKELLKLSHLTISEIAYDVGFSDPNYFSRAFSEEFGASPSKLRNALS